MGLANIFSDSANFTGILSMQQSTSSAPPFALKVSHVAHKAFIDVNPIGAVAATATDAAVIPTVAPFNAVHPFVFLLKTSTEILCIGRFME